MANQATNGAGRAHQSGPLQLLASVQRVAVLEHPHIVCNGDAESAALQSGKARPLGGAQCSTLHCCYSPQATAARTPALNGVGLLQASPQVSYAAYPATPCQSGSGRCSAAPAPTCSGPGHTAHLTGLRRRGECRPPWESPPESAGGKEDASVGQASQAASALQRAAGRDHSTVWHMARTDAVLYHQQPCLLQCSADTTDVAALAAGSISARDSCRATCCCAVAGCLLTTSVCQLPSGCGIKLAERKEPPVICQLLLWWLRTWVSLSCQLLCVNLTFRM